MRFQGFIKGFSRAALSRRAAVFLTIAAVLSCLATYSVMAKRSTDIDTVYRLLNLDLILLLLMGTVVARQVVRLWSERKQGIAGAKLHVRLVFIFGVLAAAPAILMAVFSSVFLYFGIHAWFNDHVSTAVHESLEVAQAYLKEHQQVMRADVLATANDLNRQADKLSVNPQALDDVLQTEAELRGLPEVIVVTPAGKVLAHSQLAFTLELDIPPRHTFQEAQKGDVVLMTGDSQDRIRALVKLDSCFDCYLYAGRLVDATVLAHMQTTQNAVKEYTTLQGKKTQLQVSVTAMFIAITLLLLLAAIWFGLVFAEQLVTPISALILAAEHVRQGDLKVRVPESSNDDEIGLLGRAFNRMTDQIEEQRDELVAANRMLDERRRFTEAVLSGASSGVIGLNAEGFITLANSRAAEVLLGDSHHSFAGARLIDFIPAAVDLLQKAHQAPDKPAALQLEFAVGDGPRKTVFLRITAEQGGDGAVATIDDITALVSAQKKSAWADVARRIAHEIKNPLTPIQLAAERLKRKYLPQIHDDPETFEKCTDTIVRQVGDIGRMVGEFSAYARMPQATKQVENIVDVCQDALVLQKQAHPDMRFGFIASEPVIRANCDRSQLTQVITNLLQNAIDSVHERLLQQPGQGNVKLVVEQRGENILISVEDNGLGLPEKSRDQLLEPYVTTKKKGSGLGLAIVKKIMEDHEGSVVLEDSVLPDTDFWRKSHNRLSKGYQILMSANILIVDDQDDIRMLIQGILTDEGYTTQEARDAQTAVKLIAEKAPDMVVLDIWLENSDMDGMALLKKLAKSHQHMPVIMISGHGSIETAVSAIQYGAYDFIEKPFKADRLLVLTQRAVEAGRLRRENQELRLRALGSETALFGDSSLLQQVRQNIQRVAPTGSRVLITGSPGTGKNVAARMLHNQSKRADKNYVVLNCAILSPERIEMELFGAEGALGRKQGVLEQANGGTLFLDEVADMPLETQAKIVRVLQDQNFMRLGGSERVDVDIRVIAASNQNLLELMKQGKFREDLYYRLNVVPIAMPALQERLDDIPVLADYFMSQAALSTNSAARVFAADAVAVMQAYDWPGNVRQLRNVIEWLLIMAAGEPETPITADMLPPDLKQKAAAMVHGQGVVELMSKPLREAREIFEREYLLSQVNRFGGNISKTAGFIGMERSALHRKLKSLGIQTNDKDQKDLDEREVG